MFRVAWVKKEEKASEHRQRKREAEEADKVEVAPPGVTVESLTGPLFPIGIENLIYMCFFCYGSSNGY